VKCDTTNNRGINDSEVAEIARALSTSTLQILRYVSLAVSFSDKIDNNPLFLYFSSHDSFDSLGGNQITDAGAIAIAEALKVNTGLQYL